MTGGVLTRATFVKMSFHKDQVFWFPGKTLMKVIN